MRLPDAPRPRVGSRSTDRESEIAPVGVFLEVQGGFDRSPWFLRCAPAKL